MSNKNRRLNKDNIIALSSATLDCGIITTVQHKLGFKQYYF
jgi:hypothetical protein